MRRVSSDLKARKNTPQGHTQGHTQGQTQYYQIEYNQRLAKQFKYRDLTIQ